MVWFGLAWLGLVFGVGVGTGNGTGASFCPLGVDSRLLRVFFYPTKVYLDAVASCVTLARSQLSLQSFMYQSRQFANVWNYSLLWSSSLISFFIHFKLCLICLDLKYYFTYFQSLTVSPISSALRVYNIRLHTKYFLLFLLASLSATRIDGIFNGLAVSNSLPIRSLRFIRVGSVN